MAHSSRRTKRKEMERVRCALWCVCCRKSRGEREEKFVAVIGKERATAQTQWVPFLFAHDNTTIHIFRLISVFYFFSSYSYLSICRLRINFIRCRARPGVRNFDFFFLRHRSFAIWTRRICFFFFPAQVSSNMHDCVYLTSINGVAMNNNAEQKREFWISERVNARLRGTPHGNQSFVFRWTESLIIAIECRIYGCSITKRVLKAY